MKKQVIKIVIMLIGTLLIYNIKGYCTESTVKMQINNGKVWTNINVSTAYDLCDKLNLPDSSLGTTSLEAHLTTDADWSAMAIFSTSQYGGATNNSPNITNGNITGLYGIGYSFSTGILETVTRDTASEHVKGLFNEDGSVKKYVKKWNTNRKKTGFVGFNETFGYMGSWAYYDGSTYFPVSAKNGLYGVAIGYYAGGIIGTRGEANVNVTFRPVIWN